MKKELVASFKRACNHAKEIAEMPDFSEQEYDRIFANVSNSDMETTVRTIRYAYSMMAWSRKEAYGND